MKKWWISGPPRVPVEQRFWTKVRKGDGCWEWIGGRAKSGHGRISRNKEDGHVYAHRLSWEINRGPIPDGMEVCHNCPGGDNPSCVNPAHLFLGTHADNMADMVNKGRQAMGQRNGRAREAIASAAHVVRPSMVGAGNPKAKLSTAEVEEIRAELKRGARQIDLAARFGVGQGAISRIKLNRTWPQSKPKEEAQRDAINSTETGTE